MESLQPPASFHVATTQRTSIPLRSILNVEDGRGSAQEVPSTPPPPPPPPPSEIEVSPAKKLAVQRSQFLFVNTHDTSRPNARLRQDQKVINAHVQHTSHRKRRAAAIDRLKQTLRLCRQCAESRPYRLVAAPERPSSPSSSASESSPASTSTSVGSGPLRRPLQIGTSSTHLCGQCGTSLQNPPRSHTEQDGRQRAVGTTSPMTITLASAKEKAPPLTLFVEEQPTSLLDTGMIDPFATSSVSMNMEMNGVLIHFVNIVVGGMYPVRREAAAQTEFSFQICLAEPSALYAVLAVSSADLQARTGRLSARPVEIISDQGTLVRQKMPAYMDYKLKAIEAVNKKMTSTEKAAEVTTMVVVMSLMLIESITGNQNELAKHVSEWQKLLALRGGYHGLPTGVTSAAIPISYMSATITQSFPISPPPPSPLPAASEATYKRIASNTDPQLQKIGSRLFEPDIANLFHESLVHCFHDLREVILYREFFHNEECILPEVEVEYFSVKAYKTLYRATSLPFRFPRALSPQQEPCRLALLVFWYANYGIHLPDSGMLRSLTIQLKRALGYSDPHALWHPHYRLFIWVTFLGAYISEGQPEHSWFMMYLARAARQRHLTTSEDLKTALQSFFYIDRIYRKRLESIWNEASLLMDAI